MTKLRLDILEQAKAIRDSMNKVTENLTDEQAVEVMELYLPWVVGEAVAVGDMRRDGGKLYRCLQAHTTAAEWKPADVPALWVEIAPAGEYREIKDNMLPTEAFAMGEVGWYLEKTHLYRSLIDNNVYTPVSYPESWEVYIK